MSLDANTLSLGAEDSKLEVLGEVVDDHEQDIVDYLESLLITSTARSVSDGMPLTTIARRVAKATVMEKSRRHR